MAIGGPGRVGALAAVALLILSGCARPTTGTPAPDRAAADSITVEAGIKAFQDHFANLGDEHAKVFNFLNYGDTKYTTEHESYKLGDPPMTVLMRRRDEDADSSAILHPPDDPMDYVRLDSKHAHLAPTPWVAVPTLYEGGFQTCFLLTAWLACHLDNAITQTTLDAPDRQPARAQRTDDGVEVTTGALLGLMIDEGFITIPEDQRSGVTASMRDEVVPVVIRLTPDLEFTGFEIRGKVTDGDAEPLELQVGYEVVGGSSEGDFPAKPDAGELTTITDETAADKFWTNFNTRDPA
ncbi:MAG: hypothetical protein GEV28_39180 [Actinophytocola sp.]|uniref:hypothetical protein n=1 Tax=Actinophytocola sp. TaxID=1872138 RepID=UPI00132C758C|nr:hypothetical protein [Actinophytocola sp.]MPZ86075.1 hypothetical protein [Actinophytocola sp.]